MSHTRPKQTRIVVTTAGFTSDVPLADLAKGEYLVAPTETTKRIQAPTKRLFHLGDVKGLSFGDHNVLAKYGIANSNDVRRVGLNNLEALHLTSEGMSALVGTFDALDMPIPQEGIFPDKAHKIVQKRLKKEFVAYRIVWDTKESMRSMMDAPVSSFVVHGAGIDVVCGVCGQQHLSLQEETLLEAVCRRCGNDLGVDFMAEKQRLSFVADEQ